MTGTEDSEQSLLWRYHERLRHHRLAMLAGTGDGGLAAYGPRASCHFGVFMRYEDDYGAGRSSEIDRHSRIHPYRRNDWALRGYET